MKEFDNARWKWNRTDGDGAYDRTRRGLLRRPGNARIGQHVRSRLWAWPRVWSRRRAGRAGRRNRFHATGLTGEPQLDTLKAQAEYFENALGDIRQRIEELRAKAGQDTGESRG